MRKFNHGGCRKRRDFTEKEAIWLLFPLFPPCICMYLCETPWFFLKQITMPELRVKFSLVEGVGRGPDPAGGSDFFYSSRLPPPEFLTTAYPDYRIFVCKEQIRNFVLIKFQILIE
jgi:hypothetical protein